MSPTRLPRGITVGHWSDRVGRTGCTVVLAQTGAVGGVDVRGGAPGTLGTDAMRAATRINTVDAVLLTGGSAFGLDAASGVMRFLEERGVGSSIGPATIPIVAAAVLFDLAAGDPRARPTAVSGYAACESATPDPDTGAVGAGTGATVAKAGDGRDLRAGGLGIAGTVAGGSTVAAVMAVNSVGAIWDDERCEWVAPLSGWNRASHLLPGANTTIGVVVTDAALTKEQANRVATVAHDGVARAVRPAHTLYDGDTMFCMATGAVEVPADVVEVAAAEVVARAIAEGVRAAQPAE